MAELEETAKQEWAVEERNEIAGVEYELEAEEFGMCLPPPDRRRRRCPLDNNEVQGDEQRRHVCRGSVYQIAVGFRTGNEALHDATVRSLAPLGLPLALPGGLETLLRLLFPFVDSAQLIRWRRTCRAVAATAAAVVLGRPISLGAPELTKRQQPGPRLRTATLDHLLLSSGDYCLVEGAGDAEGERHPRFLFQGGDRFIERRADGYWVVTVEPSEFGAHPCLPPLLRSSEATATVPPRGRRTWEVFGCCHPPANSTGANAWLPLGFGVDGFSVIEHAPEPPQQLWLHAPPPPPTPPGASLHFGQCARALSLLSPLERQSQRRAGFPCYATTCGRLFLERCVATGRWHLLIFHNGEWRPLLFSSRPMPCPRSERASWLCAQWLARQTEPPAAEALQMNGADHADWNLAAAPYQLREWRSAWQCEAGIGECA